MRLERIFILCHAVAQDDIGARFYEVVGIPLIFINRPTRRSPTSRPASLSSIVMRGRPPFCNGAGSTAKAKAVVFADIPLLLQNPVL